MLQNWSVPDSLRMQEVDNLTLRRFLRARDHNVEKASAMLLKALRWRREAVPGGSVPEEKVQSDLDDDKVYMGGADRTGRPILLAFPAKHFSTKRDMPKFKSTSSLDSYSPTIMTLPLQSLTCGGIEGWDPYTGNCNDSDWYYGRESSPISTSYRVYILIPHF